MFAVMPGAVTKVVATAVTDGCRSVWDAGSCGYTAVGGGGRKRLGQNEVAPRSKGGTSAPLHAQAGTQVARDITALIAFCPHEEPGGGWSRLGVAGSCLGGARKQLGRGRGAWNSWE